MIKYYKKSIAKIQKSSVFFNTYPKNQFNFYKKKATLFFCLTYIKLQSIYTPKKITTFAQKNNIFFELKTLKY